MNIAKRAAPLNFIDTLFVLLLAVLAATMIKQSVPTDDGIVQKAEFIIDLTWDDGAKSDLDLWVGPPNGAAIFFGNKQFGPFSLARDDLGYSNDQYVAPDGSTQIVRVNNEVTTFRAVVPGQYRVNVHSYAWRDDAPISATVRLIRLNPFKVEITRPMTFEMRGQELIAFNFTIGKDGRVTGINYEMRSLLQGQGRTP